MNYYYDLILNWSEDKAYNFYEWNDNDALELIKKIPIFKIKHKIFTDLVQNKIKIDEDTTLLIKDKTILNNNSLIQKIEYACLFTDGKSVIAKEFNNKGEEISESYLLVEDELNILEVNYNLKDYNLNYTILSPKKSHPLLRQEALAKDLIKIEINSLYQAQNQEKLRYLYYEYCKENITDLDLIYQNIMADLNKSLDDNILKLYYLIKLSYHKV